MWVNRGKKKVRRIITKRYKRMVLFYIPVVKEGDRICYHSVKCGESNYV